MAISASEILCSPAAWPRSDRRSSSLAERAPERAEEFEIARRRLTGKGDNEMGALFKAMAIANRSLARLPGFDTT